MFCKEKKMQTWGMILIPHTPTALAALSNQHSKYKKSKSTTITLKKKIFV